MRRLVNDRQRYPLDEQDVASRERRTRLEIRPQNRACALPSDIEIKCAGEVRGQEVRTKLVEAQLAVAEIDREITGQGWSQGR